MNQDEATYSSSQLSSPCTPILALVKITFQKIPIGQPAPVANMTFQVRTTLANLYKWILFFRFEAYVTKVKASKKYLERYKTLAPPKKKQGGENCHGVCWATYTNVGSESKSSKTLPESCRESTNTPTPAAPNLLLR